VRVLRRAAHIDAFDLHMVGSPGVVTRDTAPITVLDR
jgi:hypothetical protein